MTCLCCVLQIPGAASTKPADDGSDTLVLPSTDGGMGRAKVSVQEPQDKVARRALDLCEQIEAARPDSIVELMDPRLQQQLGPGAFPSLSGAGAVAARSDGRSAARANINTTGVPCLPWSSVAGTASNDTANADNNGTTTGGGDDDNNFAIFTAAMMASDFVIEQEAGDGNCLFSSIAHQLYGDSDQHDRVRQAVCGHLEEHHDYFSGFSFGGSLHVQL